MAAVTICSDFGAQEFFPSKKYLSIYEDLIVYLSGRFYNLLHIGSLLLLLLLSRFSRSDSLRPHKWQPTRLPCPWDSPGKNTGVGCYFLLQCMKVKIESEVAQSCLLVGVFNLFTFKVIIDIRVPIAIVLIVWGWFCRCFFFSCVSWLYKSVKHLL